MKFTGVEKPPSDAGFSTVTGAVPILEMLEAGIAAVNCVELTRVVGAADPSKLTSEDAIKFVPLIVSVNPAPPATALFGEMDVIVGV